MLETSAARKGLHALSHDAIVESTVSSGKDDSGSGGCGGKAFAAEQRVSE